MLDSPKIIIRSCPLPQPSKCRIITKKVYNCFSFQRFTVNWTMSSLILAKIPRVRRSQLCSDAVDIRFQFLGGINLYFLGRLFGELLFICEVKRLDLMTPNHVTRGTKQKSPEFFRVSCSSNAEAAPFVPVLSLLNECFETRAVHTWIHVAGRDFNF